MSSNTRTSHHDSFYENLGPKTFSGFDYHVYWHQWKIPVNVQEPTKPLTKRTPKKKVKKTNFSSISWARNTHQ